MRRVLKPGGRLVINVPGEIAGIMVVMADALATHIEPELKGFVHQVFSLDDEDYLQQMIQDAGFRDATADSKVATFRLPPPKDFLWQYVYSTPLGEGVAPADRDRRAELEREVVMKWQPHVENGVLVYNQAITIAMARR